eukprot:g8269.t1
MTERNEEKAAVNFGNLDSELLNQYFEQRYGKEADEILALSRASTSRRIQLVSPGNFQDLATTSNSIDELCPRVERQWSKVLSNFGSANSPVLMYCAPFFVPQNQVRQYDKRPTFGAIRPKERRSNALAARDDASRRLHGNWENLPRVVFGYLREVMSIEKLWEFRRVCKTWRMYIESEIEVIKVGSEFSQTKTLLAKRFDCLRSLSVINGAQLIYADIMLHFSSKSLRTIRLERIRGISVYAVEALAEVGRDRLEELELIACHIADNALIRIRHLRSLRSLNLSCSKITDETWRSLASHLSDLRHVTLSDCRFLTDCAFYPIGVHLPKLESLDLSRNAQLIFERFDQLYDHKKLQKLNISYCYPTSNGFAAIAQVSSLKSLEFTFEALQKSSIERFVEERKSYGMTELIIHSNSKDPLTTIVDALKNLNGVESLDIRNCAIGGLLFRHLCTTLDWITELRSFSILPGDCLDKVYSIPEITFLHENLQVLKFPKWNGIKNPFVNQLVQSCPELRILHLQQCSKLSDPALVKLSTLPFLEELNISECSLLTHRGVGSLKRAPCLRKLSMRALPLVRNTGLYGLKGSNSITELDVSGCDSISISGLEALVLMPCLEILRAQDLSFLCPGRVRTLHRKAASLKLRIFWGDQWSE